jgi:branched-chain amino acid transport system permease protein
MLASDYLFRAILIPFLIISLAALGVNILVGYCGQISLGSGAFMAVGAYGAYNFFVRVPGMPLIPSLILGGLCATASASCSVCPACASRACTWPWPRWQRSSSATGCSCASSGSPMIRRRARSRYPTCRCSACRSRRRWPSTCFCLSILVVIGLLAKNLVRGAIGREWMAIRDMDVAAAVIGIRPMYAKLSAFAVSSFIVGVAGALWAFVYLGAWEPAAFSVDQSFRLLFMVIIGGMGSIMGSFFGAAFIVILPIALNQALPLLGNLVGLEISTAGISHAELMIFGALIVWFLIVEPHGLAKLWSIGKQKLRLWPFPRTELPSFFAKQPRHDSRRHHEAFRNYALSLWPPAWPPWHRATRIRTGQGAVLPRPVLPHGPLRTQRCAMGQRQADYLKLVNAAKAASTASRSSTKSAKPATTPPWRGVL